MADIAVTAASVVLSAGVPEEGLAGATITAGQSVYFDATTGKWKLAQRDGTIAEQGYRAGSPGRGLGMALNGASDGQPLKVAGQNCLVAGGFTVAVGVIYRVSGTAGGWTTDAAAGGNFDGVFAIGVTTASLRIIGVPAEAAT